MPRTCWRCLRDAPPHSAFTFSRRWRQTIVNSSQGSRPHKGRFRARDNWEEPPMAKPLLVSLAALLMPGGCAGTVATSSTSPAAQALMVAAALTRRAGLGCLCRSCTTTRPSRWRRSAATGSASAPRRSPSWSTMMRLPTALVVRTTTRPKGLHRRGRDLVRRRGHGPASASPPRGGVLLDMSLASASSASPHRVGEADEALKQRLWGMLHLTSLLELKPDEAEALPAVAPIGKFLPGWNSGK